jgi:mannosyltransferase
MAEHVTPIRAQPTCQTRTLIWLLAAAGVCLLAWLLFIYNLGRESMWHDEWITWEFVQQPDIAAFFSGFPLSTTHPPLNFLWAWLWVKYVGTYELQVMRLEAVILATLAVAMAYRVGADWFRSRWVGIGAAAFLATSGMLVYYAREMRMYALISLLALVSWWLLWRLAQGDAAGDRAASPFQKYGSSFLYGVSVALLLYAHYFTGFVIIVQGLVALLFYRHHLYRVLLAYVAAFALFLPWLPNAWQQLTLSVSRSGGETLIPGGTTEATSLETLHVFVERYSAGQPAFILVLIALAFILGLGASRFYRRQLTLAGAWLFVTPVLLFTVNLITTLYNPRYLMTTLPALALVAGVAVDRLPRPARVGMVTVIIVVGLMDHSQAFLPAHTPHRQLLGVVASEYMPGDRIWYNLHYGALGSSLSSEVEYYVEYVYPLLTPDKFIWDAPDDLVDVNAVSRVWDIRSQWIPVPEDVEDVLTQGRSISEEYGFSVFKVRLYEAQPRDQTPTAFADLFELLVGPMKTEYHPGDTIKLKTWWRVQEAIPLDYSLGVYLRNTEGAIISQLDLGLTFDDAPTSQWQPSTTFELFVPELTLPPDLAPGEYSIWLGVYYWEDPRLLEISAPDESAVDREVNIIRIGQVMVNE